MNPAAISVCFAFLFFYPIVRFAFSRLRFIGACSSRGCLISCLLIFMNQATWRRGFFDIKGASSARRLMTAAKLPQDSARHLHRVILFPVKIISISASLSISSFPSRSFHPGFLMNRMKFRLNITSIYMSQTITSCRNDIHYAVLCETLYRHIEQTPGMFTAVN